VLASTLIAWLACSAPVATAPRAPSHPTDRPWIDADTIELPTPITFPAESIDVVDDEQRALLEDVAVILRNHPEIFEVDVHGAAGTVEANKHPRLAEQRTWGIAGAILSHGVEKHRLTHSHDVTDRLEAVGFSLQIRRGLTATQVKMRRPLNFFPQTATFGPENDEPLGDALAVLSMKPELQLDVLVTGVPDGPEAVSLETKQLRAEAIVQWFAAHGVDPVRLRPLGVEPDEAWTPGNDVRLLIRP
jgi:hypothetical protein